MNVIRSHNHEIFAEIVNKVALMYYNDDKKIICKDGIHTYHTFISVYKLIYYYILNNILNSILNNI